MKKQPTVIGLAEHSHAMARKDEFHKLTLIERDYAMKQIKELQQRNDNQSAQLQNFLNKEEAWTAKQSAFEQLIKAQEDCLKESNNKLSESRANYEHRHNHCLQADATIQQLRRDLDNERFQYSTFKNEVMRLLMLQQFPGGLNQPELLTRCRNRILKELAPVPEQGEAMCVVTDRQNERPKTPEEIEQAA